MNMTSGSLLVVDDQEMNRDMLARRFEVEGYSVTTAENGRQALDLVATRSFDLVLLDVMMPDMNGLEVLSRLRKTHSSSELPVIMVTAKGQSEDTVDAFELGANDYVIKPIDMQVALARIASQLSGRRAVAALRESELRYSLAAQGANDGLWDWDLRTNTLYYSTRWKAMLGFEELEIGSAPGEWLGRIHPEDLPQVEAALAAHRRGQTSHFESEHRMRHKDGSYRWVLSRGIAVRDTGGIDLRMAGSQTDITRGKAVDSLTGLPNRVLFADRLSRALERAAREPDYRFAILFLDVDRFKIINDSLGHLAGDQLLMGLATRLESCVRHSDTLARSDRQHTVARFGGDEFIILLDDIVHSDNARNVADRILVAVAQPFVLDGREVFTGVSIGITLNEARNPLADDILRDADTAMYHAKLGGKGRYVVFEPSMRTAAMTRLQVEMDLRRAIERHEFRVYYQPIVSLSSDRIVGFEALLRWEHPERGLVGPNEFIGIAEETGLISPIGNGVLHTACGQMAAWHAEFSQHPPQTICVNVSPKQFEDPELVEEIARVLAETGLDPHSLKLEITEGAIMDDPQAAAEILARLRELDIQVGIDDFGTGYSSLSYLQQFPIDTLKIDRSFINRMGAAAETSEIVETIVSLAHNLKMDVVAEGVERADQKAHLRNVDCEYGQGYWFSHPVIGQAAGELLAADIRKFGDREALEVAESVAS